MVTAWLGRIEEGLVDGRHGAVVGRGHDRTYEERDENRVEHDSPRTRPPNSIAALVRRTRLPRGRLPDKLGYVKRASRKLPQLLGARGASGESFLWQLRSSVRTAAKLRSRSEAALQRGPETSEERIHASRLERNRRSTRAGSGRLGRSEGPLGAPRRSAAKPGLAGCAHRCVGRRAAGRPRALRARPRSGADSGVEPEDPDRDCGAFRVWARTPIRHGGLRGRPCRTPKEASMCSRSAEAAIPR